MRHIIPISGKDSCAAACVQTARCPELDYELFFSDVGAELPETYAWLDAVEKKLGRKIVRVGKSLEKIIFDQNILPSAQRRFCTRMGKIEPMEEFIGDDEVTVYFGMRADEDRVGFVPSRHNVTPAYPLRDLGIGLAGVYAVLEAQKLFPPRFFWRRMYEAVLKKLRSRPRGLGLLDDPEKYLTSIPQWAYDHLFSWRLRSNCYFCLFQAPWELVGLLEHHPTLFDRAQEIEERIGNDRQEKPYYWIRDYSLSRIRKERELIFIKRVASVIRFLKTKRIVGRDSSDLLSVTSCGFFCGK